jgi:hypothetical protein
MLRCVALMYVEWLSAKDCVKEEGEYRLSPSSTTGGGTLEQLNSTTQAQSVCVRDEINMRYRFHHHV